MLNFNSILVFSEKPEKLSEFYKKVFERSPDMTGGEYFGFLVGSGFITFGPHDKVKGKSKNPERIMFNLETRDVEKEFDRVSKIDGTKVIAGPYAPGEDQHMLIATFADPDGNIFQIQTPWEEAGMDDDQLN